MTALLASIALGGLLAAITGPAMASDHLPPPAYLDRRAGFDQRIGADVPMQLPFHDSAGRRVTLEKIANGKPMLLALGYYHCPNLCDAVLHGLAQSVAALSLRIGSDYSAVFVSIDPAETPSDAQQDKRMLAAMFPAAHVERWHFLTGDESSSRALAAAIGYRYFFDPRIGQFAHPAGIVVLTGDGHVAQYAFGVAFRPQTLRLALVDASHGRVGNVIDQFVLLCCGYDPTTGRYSLAISRVMQALGAAFSLLLVGGLLWLHRRKTT